MAESIKVAVRVRPFNSREHDHGAKLIIDMNGNTTSISDPNDNNAEPRKFTFDYSYWSHDNFKEASNGELLGTSNKYATQQTVFDDVGRGVLRNAWEGYNCSLFAYGQTGSGKSYSMVGYGINKGIVPIICDELFKGIKEQSEKGNKTQYKVMLSMLEIYNEQVRDLLSSKKAPKGGMKVRQHPSKGFYVEGLLTVPVSSYDDIDSKIAEGTTNRTVAATQMNATSSRAHTVVTITFVQVAKNDNNQEMTKMSSMNLVDLAGSERADSTGATGDRLKEGSAINQSLSSLGKVIAALAEQSMGKKKTVVPFRDSTLTKLLQNALGGNSKTIMIAALSPAGINYEETLSTLRFADRAKQIKTKATINENPTDKLIRELKEENNRLKKMMEGQEISEGGGMSPEEIERMRKQMEDDIRTQLMENELAERNMKRDWDEQLQEARAGGHISERAKMKEEMKHEPYFSNINEDSQLSGVVVHFVREGTIHVGRQGAEPEPSIVLSGLSIQDHHCILARKKKKIKIKPSAANAKVLLNGSDVEGATELHDGDIIMFGSNHLFLFTNPLELGKHETPKIVSWEDAQKQIAEKQGFGKNLGGGSGNDAEDILLQEDLITLMPMVNEANAMSEELNKKVMFEIALMSPATRGLTEGRTEVCVKMRSLVNDNSWMWPRSKFVNRKFIMQEMYQAYVDHDEDWDLSQEKDPFWEPLDAEVQIGTCHIFLQSLAYMLDFDETLNITNYKGVNVGSLKVELVPCRKDGSDLSEEEHDVLFVEESSELIGKDINFKIKFPWARGLPAKYSRGIFCRYKFYLDKEAIQTDTVPGPNPDFNAQNVFCHSPATEQFIKYLDESLLVVEVWGMQTDTSKQNIAELTTRELVQARSSSVGRRKSVCSVEDKGRLHKIMCEKAVFERRCERYEKRYVVLKETLRKAKEAKKTEISIEELEKALDQSQKRFKGIGNVIKQAKAMEMAANKKNIAVFAKSNVSSACSIQ